MTIIYIFPTRYICRIDPLTGDTVLNAYTPVEFN